MTNKTMRCNETLRARRAHDVLTELTNEAALALVAADGLPTINQCDRIMGAAQVLRQVVTDTHTARRRRAQAIDPANMPEGEVIRRMTSVMLESVMTGARSWDDAIAATRVMLASA